MPGISVFQREGKNIARVSDTQFRAGDDFCTVFHMFDMSPAGVDGWSPKKQYASIALLHP